MPPLPDSSTDLTSPSPHVPLRDQDLAPGSRLRLAFLRGIVWSLIGMIYAPLFLGLSELLSGLGWGYASYVGAAGLAGAAGAVLYGARELAIISTGLGAIVGVAMLIVFSGGATLAGVVLLAAALAAAVGLTVAFPKRCSRHVPGKALAGLMTGAFSGAVLAVAESLHSAPFSIFPTLAFLVSVTGVLYVGTVRGWVALAHRMRLEAHPCYLIEAAIMAALAGVAAGSVWMVSGPLLGVAEGPLQSAMIAMHSEIRQAVLGGLFGGGVAGVLLQAFRFSWVHDL